MLVHAIFSLQVIHCHQHERVVRASCRSVVSQCFCAGLVLKDVIQQCDVWSYCSHLISTDYEHPSSSDKQTLDMIQWRLEQLWSIRELHCARGNLPQVTRCRSVAQQRDFTSKLPVLRKQWTEPQLCQHRHSGNQLRSTDCAATESLFTK